mgnify:CR=1 FL=1
MSLIFDKIAESFSAELPFTSFRKPNGGSIKGFFCNTSEVNYAQNFNEEGFVFSPFDNLEASIIFHEKSAQILEDVFNEEVLEETKNELKTVYSNREEHLQLVSKGINRITEGDIKKVVLSRKEDVQVSNFDLVTTFKRLLATYHNAFIYVWYHPKVGLWMGATPERLVTLEGNEFTTMALASTQSYNGDLNPQWGSKEKKEHQYVVDYIVSQIKDQSNGIILDEFEVSETYTTKAGNLLHLKANIKGSIGDFELKKLLKTLHPTPAVCGLPKEKSKEFILKNEEYNRSFYTGFLGEINVNQKTELFVNLRCVEFNNNTASIYVGGGVTIDSDPEKEWMETVSKTKTIKSIL